MSQRPSSPSGDSRHAAGLYDLFILGLCVYVLFALAIMTFLPLDASVIRVLEYADVGICVIFLVDFIVQLTMAKSKWGYLKWGWIDLISSIPMVGPLRWGRFARVVRILRLLRGVKSAKMISHYIARRRSDSAFAAAAFVAILTVILASIAVLYLERDYPAANITSAEDALWWATSTIATVGYGDRYPVSTGGRVVAVITMIVGVGLFGTFTAFVSTWFIEPAEQQQDAELDEVRDLLTSIDARLRKLTEHHLERD